MANVLLCTLCVCLPLMIGCATKQAKLMESAQKHYQANAYETALNDAVAALKLKPNYQQAQDLAPTVFKAAVEAREGKIKELEPSSEKFKWDAVVAHYNGLIKINNLVKNLPPLTHKKTKERITFDTKDYTEQLGIASEKAAEAHYQEGIRLAASSDDIETQKKAAKEFKKAEVFVNDYKDSHSRYEKAKSAAIKRMAIMSFENKSGKEQYGAISDMLTDRISSNILGDNSATEFLGLVSRNELERVIQEQKLGLTGLVDEQSAQRVGEILGVDEIVVGSINYIDYNAPPVREERLLREKTVRRSAGKETYIDKNGKEKTRTKYVNVPIEASVTKFHREAEAKMEVSYKILKVRTAELVKSDTFSGSSKFEHEWGKFSGDKDALSRQDRKLCSKSEEYPPTENEMVRGALKEVANDLSETLIKYAR